MSNSLPSYGVQPTRLKAKILEWITMPSSRGSSWPSDRTCISYLSYIGRWVLYHQHHLGSPLSALPACYVALLLFMVERGKVLVAQSCSTLCNPMDCSLPGSAVHGILQARILEWVVVPFSRGSSQSRDQTQVSCFAGRFFTVWDTREASGNRESDS